MTTTPVLFLDAHNIPWAPKQYLCKKHLDELESIENTNDSERVDKNEPGPRLGVNRDAKTPFPCTRCIQERDD